MAPYKSLIGTFIWDKASRRPACVLQTTLIAALIILVALAGCKTQHHQQVIIVDGWWTYDYAEETCSRIAQIAPCIQDSKQMAFQLEKDFAGGFQENPSCSNLQLFRGFRNPQTTDAKTPEILRNADWTIQFNVAVQDGVLNPTNSTWQISSKGSTVSEIRYADGDLKNPLPQQYLWVSSGSGSRPRL